jgi:hypothetical protein
LPLSTGFRLSIAPVQNYLFFVGRLVRFASARHTDLIAEKLSYSTYVSINPSIFSYQFVIKIEKDLIRLDNKKGFFIIYEAKNNLSNIENSRDVLSELTSKTVD